MITEYFGIFAIGVVSGVMASGVIWLLGLVISNGISTVFKNNF
jgi:hypothetical protein